MQARKCNTLTVFFEGGTLAQNKSFENIGVAARGVGILLEGLSQSKCLVSVGWLYLEHDCHHLEEGRE